MPIQKLVGKILTLALCGLVCLIETASADDIQSNLLVIRQQPAIALSYNFQPLAPDAGKGILVAVIGTGISRDLKGQLGERVSAESVPADSNDPFQKAEVSHPGNNGWVSIIAALAPQAKIVSIKALGDGGNGSFTDIRKAIDRAVQLGARIIVLPIVAGPSSQDPEVTAAIKKALAQNVLIVEAAGNEPGGPPGYPANLEGVVAIGAAEGYGGHSVKDLKISPFSSYSEKILFVAGADIKSLSFSGQIVSHSGTSYSAAVAGAIFAVLWSQAPNLTREQLVNIVMKHTVLIDSRRPGRLVDGQAALNALKQ